MAKGGDRLCGQILLSIQAEFERFKRDIVRPRDRCESRKLAKWVYKFGPKYAESLRKNSSQRFTDKWHRDEVHGKIQGKAYWLWRAVDSKGQEIDILRQPRRSVLTDFFEKYWGKTTILIPELL